jgi:hypothetical protein
MIFLRYKSSGFIIWLAFGERIMLKELLNAVCDNIEKRRSSLTMAMIQ